MDHTNPCPFLLHPYLNPLFWLWLTLPFNISHSHLFLTLSNPSHLSPTTITASLTTTAPPLQLFPFHISSLSLSLSHPLFLAACSLSPPPPLVSYLLHSQLVRRSFADSAVQCRQGLPSLPSLSLSLSWALLCLFHLTSNFPSKSLPNNNSWRYGLQIVLMFWFLFRCVWLFRSFASK